MEQKTLKPYSDYIYIQPVEKKNQYVTDKGKLQTYGKVIAIGKDVVETQVGDYVAFELWDKPEFELPDQTTAHLVREKDVLCKIPQDWIQNVVS